MCTSRSQRTCSGFKKSEDIQRIRLQNNTLQEDINKSVQENSKINRTLLSQIQKVQSEGSVFAQKVEVEQGKNVHLEEKARLRSAIEALEQQIQALKQKNPASVRENQKNSKAKLKQLEQQLLQINQRHNHALSVVRKLKEEVNQVRRERVIFDSVFKKLEQDLKCKDEELMSSLAQTIKHEKTRDEILEELRVIRALYGEQKQSMLERTLVTFRVRGDLRVAALRLPQEHRAAGPAARVRGAHQLRDPAGDQGAARDAGAAHQHRDERRLLPGGARV